LLEAMEAASRAIRTLDDAVTHTNADGSKDGSDISSLAASSCNALSKAVVSMKKVLASELPPPTKPSVQLQKPVVGAAPMAISRPEPAFRGTFVLPELREPPQPRGGPTVKAMMVLEEMRDSALAEDVGLHDAMLSWTLADAREYLESGGEMSYAALRGGAVHFPELQAKLAAGVKPIASKDMGPFDDPRVTKLNPDAKCRLFAFHGIAEQAASMKGAVEAAPPWLEVRPFELPGHGFRKNEPMPKCAERQPSLDFAALKAEHDDYFKKLADEIEPFLNVPWAIYGFSHGTLPVYSLLVELQRRKHVPPPLITFFSGRGPLHCPPYSRSMFDFTCTSEDADLLDLMKKLKWFPEDMTPSPGRMMARAASLYRYPLQLFCHHVGDAPYQRRDGTGRGTACFDWDGGDPQQLAFVDPSAMAKLDGPVEVIYSDTDEVWVPLMQLGWCDLTAGAFGATKVQGLAHTVLACDTTQLLPTLFAKLAGRLLSTIGPRPACDDQDESQ
jgi:surfactin synthase thioesterase subunit